MTLVQLPVAGRPTRAPEPLRKIALEEHFFAPENTDPKGGFDPAAFANETGIEVEYLTVAMKRIADFHGQRLEEMDVAGIDVAILSLNGPGIEFFADVEKAKAQATHVNDFLAEQIQRSPTRFRGFASVPLLDTDAAVRELHRAVNELGFPGVLINGYVQSPDPDVGHYLDDDRFLPFWEAVAELDVPVYLHPRQSLQPVLHAMYAGHKQLGGATWGFAPETATHALRLVYSGLFDRLPKLNVILGHLGEGIPYLTWRIQKNFEYNPFGHQVERRLQDYLSDNFYITTSGNCSDPALTCALVTMGADRIMFATDYPWAMSDETARWIETIQIAERDRRKIAHGNAAALFRLDR